MKHFRLKSLDLALKFLHDQWIRAPPHSLPCTDVLGKPLIHVRSAPTRWRVFLLYLACDHHSHRDLLRVFSALEHLVQRKHAGRSVLPDPEAISVIPWRGHWVRAGGDKGVSGIEHVPTPASASAPSPCRPHAPRALV